MYKDRAGKAGGREEDGVKKIGWKAEGREEEWMEGMKKIEPGGRKDGKSKEEKAVKADIELPFPSPRQKIKN